MLVPVDLFVPMSCNDFPHDGDAVVFESSYLIATITFRNSALALSIGWEMLQYCALLRDEALTNPMVADCFFILWREHMACSAVNPKRIPNSSPL